MHQALIDYVAATAGLQIGMKSGNRLIEILPGFDPSKIPELLMVLRENKMPLCLYDALYPSPSDPGAYLAYLQIEREGKTFWGMTLGNHGWSGGIYEIAEQTIACQLEDLVEKQLLLEIEIENVSFFSSYDVQNVERSANQNAQIFNLHQSIASNDFLQLDSLIFAIFSSDNYGKYAVYKLTSDHLFVDYSERWHRDRHSREGYRFEGTALPAEAFKLAQNLFMECPRELLNSYFKGFYTTGNKNEDKLIAGISTRDFTRTLTIDSYEIETSLLPEKVRDFRIKVEEIVRALDRVPKAEMQMTREFPWWKRLFGW